MIFLLYTKRLIEIKSQSINKQYNSNNNSNNNNEEEEK